jgi:hypothetical protein
MRRIKITEARNTTTGTTRIGGSNIGGPMRIGNAEQRGFRLATPARRGGASSPRRIFDLRHGGTERNCPQMNADRDDRRQSYSIHLRPSAQSADKSLGLGTTATSNSATSSRCWSSSSRRKPANAGRLGFMRVGEGATLRSLEKAECPLTPLFMRVPVFVRSTQHASGIAQFGVLEVADRVFQRVRDVETVN